MHIKTTNLKRLFALFSLCLLITVVGCNKDKFTTKPQLEFKKASTYNVGYGGIFTFTLEFTDKEGDVSDSLWIEGSATSCPNSYLKAAYKIPNFPSKSNEQGEFSISFANNVNINGYATWPGPACQRPDTTIFRFWMRDKAGNFSDTVQVDKPIIIQNQ